MDTFRTFTTKAKKYARYRWHYAPEAVEAIFAIAGLSEQSVVADVGAGSGILTGCFAGRVKRVYALEPNAEMRNEAARRLPLGSGCMLVGASAEALPLPAASVDLITVAQAIHWFEPQAARREFTRVISPGGWLVIMRNEGKDEALGQALEEIYTPGNWVDESKASPPEYRRPPEFYFGGTDYTKCSFPFISLQDWDCFIGALCSTSYLPDECHPAFPRFEKAVRAVFDRFSKNGVIQAKAETQVLIGKFADHNQEASLDRSQPQEMERTAADPPARAVAAERSPRDH